MGSRFVGPGAQVLQAWFFHFHPLSTHLIPSRVSDQVGLLTHCPGPQPADMRTTL